MEKSLTQQNDGGRLVFGKKKTEAELLAEAQKEVAALKAENADLKQRTADIELILADIIGV